MFLLGLFPALVCFILFLLGHFGTFQTLCRLATDRTLWRCCHARGVGRFNALRRWRVSLVSVLAFPVADFETLGDVLDVRLDCIGVLIQLLGLLAFLLCVKVSELGMQSWFRASTSSLKT
jgi:hypothetical protein